MGDQPGVRVYPLCDWRVPLHADRAQAHSCQHGAQGGLVIGPAVPTPRCHGTPSKLLIGLVGLVVSSPILNVFYANLRLGRL